MNDRSPNYVVRRRDPQRPVYVDCGRPLCV